jgi:hypothetical protein
MEKRFLVCGSNATSRFRRAFDCGRFGCRSSHGAGRFRFAADSDNAWGVAVDTRGNSAVNSVCANRSRVDFPSGSATDLELAPDDSAVTRVSAGTASVTVPTGSATDVKFAVDTPDDSAVNPVSAVHSTVTSDSADGHSTVSAYRHHTISAGGHSCARGRRDCVECLGGLVRDTVAQPHRRLPALSQRHTDGDHARPAVHVRESPVQ